MFNFILVILICLLGSTAVAGTDGPWSSHIQEEHDLTDCKNTQIIYDAAVRLDIKLQDRLDDPGVKKEVKTLIKAEQEGLWQLEHDLTLWMNTNCKET